MKRKKAPSIDAIGQLVPEGPQRKRFFELMAVLRHAPEDDEQRQFMEMVGFTTLILKQIPDEIAATLAKAQSGLTDGQAEAMGRRFEEVLKDSIDTPSYKDLREAVRQIKEERGKFQHNIETVSRAIKALPAMPYRGTFTTKALVWTAVLSVTVGAVAALAGVLLTKVRLPEPIVDLPRAGHQPMTMAEIFDTPQQVIDYVDYFEDTLPAYQQPVGVFIVKGGILDVVQETDKGVVVVALPDGALPELSRRP